LHDARPGGRAEFSVTIFLSELLLRARDCPDCGFSGRDPRTILFLPVRWLGRQFEAPE
jgi:hypothetical protein